MNVLVVDDNQDLRRLMESALTFAGHTVSQCPGGEDALRSLAHTEPLPDAVVLDVQMPVLDGWATLAQIRAEARTAGLAVVLCTVKSRSADVARGWEAGSDGYLVKPFDLDRFVRVVEEAAARDAPERIEHRNRMLADVRAQLTT